jgi:hypothetical protein
MPPTDAARATGFGGIALAWFPHHVEHLAPWCALLGMPIVLPEHPVLRHAVLAYPGLDAEWVPGVWQPNGIVPLAAAVRARAPRVVFYSELFDRDTLRSLFGGGSAAPRVVYAPHGFSEKRQGWARGTAFQDVAVLYGRHALDQLEAFGVADRLHRCVFSGNVRRGYYRAHERHFRAQGEGLGLARDGRTRTLLYAPTWDDAIGSSSFFAAFEAVASAVPAGWRLVAKLHPHAERHAAAIDRIEAAFRGRGVHLVRRCPLTYPLLDLADAYLGDMSSLAYDFLACGRPMFFTNPTSGTARDAAASRLFACGTVIPPHRYGDVWRIVEDAWDADAERYGEARAALDAYTHAPERDAAALRVDMTGACAGPAPAWMSAAAAAPGDAA